MKPDPHGIMDISFPIEERMRALMASLNQDPKYKGLALQTLQGIEFLSACQETQSAQFTFPVEPILCNASENLHGGIATTLFDALTTVSLLTIIKPGYWDTFGVSRTLTVTFLRPLPVGTKVFLDCEVVAAGKRMVNLKGTMKTADGKVCVTCIHDKAAVESSKL